MSKENLDIFGSLVLNVDQANFKSAVFKAMDRLRPSMDIGTIRTLRGAMPGYRHSDFVVTVNMSADGRTCEVYRNRDSKLIFAMYNERNASINWEYIFVQNHLKSLAEGNK